MRTPARPLLKWVAQVPPYGLPSTPAQVLLYDAPTMAVEGQDGIADDADSYGDLAEKDPAKAPPVRRGPGIASDAELFEGLLEESTDAARKLDSDWLYQKSGHVFGPVKARRLLEMLYEGEIDADTPVSVGEGDLTPIRRVGVFRPHLPKVEQRQKARREHDEQERRDAKRRLMRRIGLAGLAALILVVGSVGLVMGIRAHRQNAAEAEKAAQEAKLMREMEELLASVTIEPPLLPLVDEPDPPPKAGDEAKPRPRKKGVARFSGGTGGGTEELSRQEIMAGVAKAFAGFKRCIVEQIQRDSESIPEELVLTFVIDNDGSPRDVSLADRALQKTPLRGCMDGELSRVRWRKYKGEVRNVEYPITIGRR